MRVAVAGTGRGGFALAAELTVLGHDVRWWPGDRPELVERDGRDAYVHLTGIAGEHDVRGIPLLTDPSGTGDAELVVVPGPGSVQEWYIDALAPHLRAGQLLWLAQGGGASLLAARRLPRGVVPFESVAIPYSARRLAPASVHIASRIGVPTAAFPAARTTEVLDRIRPLFDLPAATNVLEVALWNVNAVIHPLPTLLNWGAIERQGGAFHVTADGMSRGVLTAMDALDDERQRVCAAAELRPLSIDDIYGLMAIAVPYRGRPRPPGRPPENFEERFLTEATDAGLVTVSSAGSAFGVTTPVVDATIALVRALGYQRGADCRTMERLGLAGRSSAAVRSYLESGIWR